jgi:predicted amidohydrolase YtcJ
MPDFDIVLKNARVITMDASQPSAELVAITQDKISFVAGKDQLAAAVGADTRVIDCQGKTVVPGFIDAHCHIFSLARQLLGIDLSPGAVKSITDIKESLRRQAMQTPPGQWLSGHGFNEFYLAEKRYPTCRDIDEAVPDHPVVLSHRSLHACVLNSRALTLAGINSETSEPPGSMIERDLTTGEPNGVLYEMLGYIRNKVIPPLSEDEITRGVQLANEQYLACGITSLQDATVSNDYFRWEAIGRLKTSGTLQPRVYQMIGQQKRGEFQEAGMASGAGNSQIRLGAVKVMVGQIMGNLKPPQAELNRLALACHKAGLQLAFHAVEESSIEAVIQALEFIKSHYPSAYRRHRIEHCAELSPSLLERLWKLEAVIVTQPPFIYYSGERYLATVPASQQPWLYRIRSPLESGIIVAAGSDSPVVANNPLVGIYAAVTRQTEAGQHLLQHEGITPQQALRLYTTNAAYASFEENLKGSITPGKLADMAVLSDDPTRVPHGAIKDITVDMTIIGGEIAWEK